MRQAASRINIVLYFLFWERTQLRAAVYGGKGIKPKSTPPLTESTPPTELWGLDAESILGRNRLRGGHGGVARSTMRVKHHGPFPENFRNAEVAFHGVQDI